MGEVLVVRTYTPSGLERRLRLFCGDLPHLLTPNCLFTRHATIHQRAHAPPTDLTSYVPAGRQVVLSFWKEFNLDGRRLQLDKQVNFDSFVSRINVVLRPFVGQTGGGVVFPFFSTLPCSKSCPHEFFHYIFLYEVMTCFEGVYDADGTAPVIF